MTSISSPLSSIRSHPPLLLRPSPASKIEQIATGLKGLGLSIWYNARLDAGFSFDEEINAELPDARSVLVCWSPNSIAARWPRAEAMFGTRRACHRPSF
jgi:hypothetical protein